MYNIIKTVLILLSSLVFATNCTFPKASKDDWRARKGFFKNVGGKLVSIQDGAIRFTFYNSIEMPVRHFVMENTKKYIADCLSIIKEKELIESIDIILLRDRSDMVRFIGDSLSGITITRTDEFIKQKTIVSVWGNKNPLKHEIMHVVSFSKWGNIEDSCTLNWLVEGLATYVAPEAECDAYSFEEKYVYFIQSKKIICADSLINGFDNQHHKISYNQSAFLVKYLIENYGVEKLRLLWTSGMHSFRPIFGMDIDDMMKQIDTALNQQYPYLIKIDWNEFEKKCF